VFAARLSIIEPYVGMMTKARTQDVRVAVETHAEVTVVAVVTAGLSHPTAAGVSSPVEWRPGTINTILLIDASLTPTAMVNAVITATEAKTLGLVEARVRAPHGELASGTSTDSMLIATTERGARFEYAGPISPVGALIGRVRRAMMNGMQKWGRGICLTKILRVSS
jgi:iron complex transport system ATP-binding protein